MQENDTNIVIIKAKIANIISQFILALLFPIIVYLAFHFRSRIPSTFEIVAGSLFAVWMFVILLSKVVKQIEINNKSVNVQYLTGICKSAPISSIKSAQISYLYKTGNTLVIQYGAYAPLNIFGSTFTSDELVNIQNIITKKMLALQTGKN